jgi:nucleoside-diphosphate-sugar epimerase
VLKNAVARLVYTSFFAVCGWSRNGELTEASPWQAGGSPYQRVKRDAERLILKFHRDQQVPVVVLQPTLVYGPFAAWTMVPVNELKTGLVPLLDNGSGYCNAVYMQEKKRQSGTVTQMIDLARDPKVSARLVSLPLVQAGFRAVRKCLSVDNWDSLKSPLREVSPEENTYGLPARPLCVPTESFLALCQSKINVRIDKARSLLGYEPKFDLPRGMHLTSEFIRWANLI